MSEVVSIELEKKKQPKFVQFQGKLIPIKKYNKMFTHKPRLLGHLVMAFTFLVLLVMFALMFTGVIQIPF